MKNRVKVEVLVDLNPMPQDYANVVVESLIPDQYNPKALSVTYFNALINEVWADLRREATDDAQQSFGDLLRAMGFES